MSSLSSSSLLLPEEQPLVFCRIELFRCVQWHSHAIQMTIKLLSIPVHYLYYESYTTNYNATVQDILQFLQQPAKAKP
ncbi:hypothetical protein ACA910_022457 [Epithemia clementina (nom. ined.)]